MKLREIRIKKNYKIFSSLFKMCKKAHTACYDELAYMYHDGLGTCINQTKALYWYKKAEKAEINKHHGKSK